MPAVAQQLTIGNETVPGTKMQGFNDQTMFEALSQARRMQATEPVATKQTLNDAITLAENSLLVGEVVATREYRTGSNRGGNHYQLLDAGTSENRPAQDYGHIIHVGNAGLYLKGLFPDGIISADRFGAYPSQQGIDSSSAVFHASLYALSLSNQMIFGSGVDINAKVDVIFSPGATYYINPTVAFDVEGVRINWGCLVGSANIVGATTGDPNNRTALGFSFNRLFRTKFYNLNFAAFGKLMEWDTNNVDSATVEYNNCEFHDCGNPGVPVIDTRSHALSRSTDLAFINCRASKCPRLLNSYCDTLRFEGGIYRNADPDGSFILADSKVTTQGGMWVPYFPGDNARWFDLYDVSVSGSRGFSEYNTRFSPENGGIPVIYNYMQGEDVAGNHHTNYINFFGGSAEAAPGAAQHDALVVLADIGTPQNPESAAPSMIGFYGASVRARAGLVRTQSGAPVKKVKGRFVIDVSFASQSHLTDVNTAMSVPLVETQLQGYLVNKQLYNKPIEITLTEDTTIDLSGMPYDAIIHVSGSGYKILGITNAFDGQPVRFMFKTGGITVPDWSSGGSNRFWLHGAADFTPNQYSTLTLHYARAENKWFEDSRSAR